MNEEGKAEPGGPATGGVGPRYFAAFLDLRGRPALVVGGGAVAARKVETLRQSGARVTVVSPELHPDLAALARQQAIIWEPRGYRPGDCHGMALVIAATDGAGTNSQVAREAQSNGIWVNVVDCPQESSFIVPAVVHRGSLSLAVSTGGASPALAARLRRRLEEQFGPEWEGYLEFLRAARRAVLAAVPDGAQRARILRGLAEADLLDAVARRDEAVIRQAVESIGGAPVWAELQKEHLWR